MVLKKDEPLWLLGLQLLELLLLGLLLLRLLVWLLLERSSLELLLLLGASEEDRREETILMQLNRVNDGLEVKQRQLMNRALHQSPTPSLHDE